MARKVRASSLAQKAVVALIVFVAVLGAATIITRGNAGPPGSFRWRNLPQSLAQGQPLAGGVDVEIVPDNEMTGIRFRLIVPIKDPNTAREE